MFADSYAKSATFTKPVIISIVHPNDKCSGGVGSFIVVNNEGWIVTAAHILDEYLSLKERKQKYLDYAAERQNIEKDAALTPARKRKKLKRLKPAADAVQDFSFWWGADKVVLKDVQGNRADDLAVARLDPFDAASVTEYPTFKNPDLPLRSGTSLCRLGFPFHDISPEYTNGRFHLPAGTFPMVFFPNEGILTRILHAEDGRRIFIETSSPGLMGQSGGPIFDATGTVWGVQSHTSHLPLGFSPGVPGGRPHEKEHQFLNVGRGVHPATIVGMLKKSGIKHSVSDY